MGLCLSPEAEGPHRMLLHEERRMALGQEQGAAWGVRHGHSLQWQSRPEALMGLPCQLMQSFPVLNIVKVVMPDIAVW